MGEKSEAKKSVFCLMGPTASGKTDLAVQLAQCLPFDIISVDSAQVYRGMDIGSGKINSFMADKTSFIPCSLQQSRVIAVMRIVTGNTFTISYWFMNG